ncbi:MAG TPA: hypothetical protein DDW52_26420 [Planctomycetaceae bacterium]|nr:hypothetical protein [Planctomycetaceae bacterium]
MRFLGDEPIGDQVFTEQLRSEQQRQQAATCVSDAYWRAKVSTRQTLRLFAQATSGLNLDGEATSENDPDGYSGCNGREQIPVFPQTIPSQCGRLSLPKEQRPAR